MHPTRMLIPWPSSPFLGSLWDSWHVSPSRKCPPLGCFQSHLHACDINTNHSTVREKANTCGAVQPVTQHTVHVHTPGCHHTADAGAAGPRACRRQSASSTTSYPTCCLTQHTSLVRRSRSAVPLAPRHQRRQHCRPLTLEKAMTRSSAGGWLDPPAGARGSLSHNRLSKNKKVGTPRQLGQHGNHGQHSQHGQHGQQYGVD